MNRKLVVAFVFPLTLALGAVAAEDSATSAKATAQRIVLKSVRVQFPQSSRTFEGAGSAKTTYCMICHSTGMIMTQPALSEAAWKAEVAKM